MALEDDSSGPRYQAVTTLPEHIEKKLLEFNILQLCALVSERNGTKWIGASDRYGPIKEISERWKIEELTLRIAQLKPEEPLKTYAKVMTALGGNPAHAKRQEEAMVKAREIFAKKTAPEVKDEVRIGLEGVLTINELKGVAKQAGLDTPEWPIDWNKVEHLANFGLKRMWVGNRWRTKIRQSKEKKE